MLAIESRRVLVTAGANAVFPIRDLFCKSPLNEWEAVEADSLMRARFVMQHHPCDVLLVNDDIYQQEGEQGLSWLRPPHVPVVILAGNRAQTVAQAYQEGANLCLSRDMAIACPHLLAAALDRVLEFGEMQRRYKKLQQQMRKCRLHMDRLVSMIWRSAPADGTDPWLSHRYALERLEEEVARAHRHGDPLTVAVGQTVAVGELHADDAFSQDNPVRWLPDVICRAKRRCDVVGQYGMGGFLLLLVKTPKSGGLICCRRLQRILHAEAEKRSGPMRACFGVAATSADRLSAQVLLCRADQNLETAKTGQGEDIVGQ